MACSWVWPLYILWPGDSMGLILLRHWKLIEKSCGLQLLHRLVFHIIHLNHVVNMIFSIAGYLHAVCYYDLGRYVSGPGIGNFKQVQKSSNVETFGQKNSIFGNFKVLPLLANSITRCLMNAQHSISDSLMMLPKLATSIIHSQHIQIWQNLCSVFIVLPITFHCGFWFPFLENCEFLPNLASIMKKPKPTM